MANAYLNLAVPGAPGNGASQAAGGLAFLKTVIVTGTFDGAIELQGSANDIDYTPIRSFNGPTVFTLPGTFEFLRVATRILNSGTPALSVGAVVGITATVNLAVPVANGVGASSAITTLGSRQTAIICGPASFGGGVVTLEYSQDGATFVPVASFTGCGAKSFPLLVGSDARLNLNNFPGAIPAISANIMAQDD